VFDKAYKGLIKFRQKTLVQDRIYILALSTAVLLLLGVTMYGAYNSSDFFSNGSDALADTYLFTNPHLHSIVLPEQHPNILKFPIFYIQGLFPYHYTSFTLVNILIVLITVAAWSLLLIRLFGARRTYTLLILILFSLLILCSPTLDINLTELSIRNIEFPIALWFIFTINRLLRGMPASRKQWAWTSLCCLLYCLTLAGDNYFEYAISLPLILVIIWYWVQSKKFSRNMFKILVLIALMSIVAAFIKLIVVKTGIILLYKPVTPSTIVNYNLIGPSFTVAFQQLLTLEGANIFGQAIGSATLYELLDFGLLITSIIGLSLVFCSISKSYRKHARLIHGNDFIYMTIAVSFFMVFSVYIFSGQVVQMLSNGQVASLGQGRYIAFMPLLGLIGIMWLIKTYSQKRTSLVVLLIVGSIMGMATSIPTIRSSFVDTIASTKPSRTVLAQTINDLHQDQVSEVLTGYNYGPPLTFWSDNTISTASILNCNQPFLFNVRKDSYSPHNHTRTALVIDRPDAVWWNCSNRMIMNIYGVPSKEQIVPDETAGPYTEIWVYNYDVRQKLLPFIQ